MKNYSKPQLQEIGALADLTHGGGMSNPAAPLDAKGGSTNFMDNPGGN